MPVVSLVKLSVVCAFFVFFFGSAAVVGAAATGVAVGSPVGATGWPPVPDIGTISCAAATRGADPARLPTEIHQMARQQDLMPIDH